MYKCSLCEYCTSSTREALIPHIADTHFVSVGEPTTLTLARIECSFCRGQEECICPHPKINVYVCSKGCIVYDDDAHNHTILKCACDAIVTTTKEMHACLHIHERKIEISEAETSPCLPPEIWFLIMSNCDKPSLFALSQTCKFFRDNITLDSKFREWMSFAVTVRPNDAYNLSRSPSDPFWDFTNFTGIPPRSYKLEEQYYPFLRFLQFKYDRIMGTHNALGHLPVNTWPEFFVKYLGKHVTTVPAHFVFSVLLLSQATLNLLGISNKRSYNSCYASDDVFGLDDIVHACTFEYGATPKRFLRHLCVQEFKKCEEASKRVVSDIFRLGPLALKSNYTLYQCPIRGNYNVLTFQ